MFVALVFTALVGYLLGSLPFGYLIARAKGVNIFEVGSKNPGATNVRRVLGAGPGNLVFALDALKGSVAAAWALGALGSKMVVDLDAPLLNLLNRTYVGADWVNLGMAGLVGALLVGVATAKALGVALDVPVYGVNHLVGHVVVDELQHGPLPVQPVKKTAWPERTLPAPPRPAKPKLAAAFAAPARAHRLTTFAWTYSRRATMDL